MKYSLITMIVFSLALSAPTIAGQEEYDDCVLEHLKGAKIDLAAQFIIQACDNNYKNPVFTSKKKLAYNACLLKHLVGVESIQAVIEIQAACGRKYN